MMSKIIYIILDDCCSGITEDIKENMLNIFQLHDYIFYEVIIQIVNGD